MRRVLLLSFVATCLALAGCSDNPPSDPPSNPMNAIVELGRPVDRGYDRTDWDPAALAAAMELAQRVGASPVGCVDPGPVAFEQVKSSFELVKLPMPGAVVQCNSAADEDLTFSSFTDEASKATFVEAKAELICGRALAPVPGAPDTTLPTNTLFSFLAYVDSGTIIIEPDSTEVRNQLAAAIGATPGTMCAHAPGDTPSTSSGP